MSGAFSRATFTIATSSFTVTSPSPLQSPIHAPGGGVGVGVAVGVGVGVRLGVGVGVWSRTSTGNTADVVPPLKQGCVPRGLPMHTS